MINFRQNRIIPELYGRDDDDTVSAQEGEDKPREKFTTEAVMSVAAKFAQQRKELKERIVKEVIDSAFPDMEDFNVTDFVIGKPVPPKPNNCIQCLQFFGCWPVSIHAAVENGSVSQLEKALINGNHKVEQEKLDKDFINEVNHLGHTALADAVRLREVELVAMLLSYRANPNIVDEDTGMTPLLYSVSSGNMPITVELLRARSDPNITDFNGITALMIAASMGDLAHCRILVRVNANIDFVDHNGWSALHYAAFGGSVDVCDFLLDQGVDRDLKDLKRRKAIHIARHLGHGAVVAYIEGYRRRIGNKHTGP